MLLASFWVSQSVKKSQIFSVLQIQHKNLWGTLNNLCNDWIGNKFIPCHPLPISFETSASSQKDEWMSKHFNNGLENGRRDFLATWHDELIGQVLHHLRTINVLGTRNMHLFPFTENYSVLVWSRQQFTLIGIICLPTLLIRTCQY